MVTTLGIEQTPTLSWGSRAVFAAAVLTALSAFAKETATVAKDRPNVSGISTTVAAPRPATPAPALKPAAKTRKLNPLTQLTRGMASWYGRVLDGHHTASGARFDMFGLTAAHRTLPFGSKVKVTDLRNHKSIIVTITDRGVLAADRIIDLSLGAAQALDMVKMGVDPVSLQVLTAREALLAQPALAQ